jgi:hypothetical protein
MLLAGNRIESIVGNCVSVEKWLQDCGLTVRVMPLQGYLGWGEISPLCRNQLQATCFKNLPLARGDILPVRFQFETLPNHVA